jgi:hypothetical protein
VSTGPHTVHIPTPFSGLVIDGADLLTAAGDTTFNTT